MLQQQQHHVLMVCLLVSAQFVIWISALVSAEIHQIGPFLLKFFDFVLTPKSQHLLWQSHNSPQMRVIIIMFSFQSVISYSFSTDWGRSLHLSLLCCKNKVLRQWARLVDCDGAVLGDRGRLSLIWIPPFIVCAPLAQMFLFQWAAALRQSILSIIWLLTPLKY